MSRRGNFAIKFANNKTLRFRTKEAYSNAFEVMSRGRFANVAQMFDRVKQCPTGFEYVEGSSNKKIREFENRFNGIDFEE